MDTNTFVSQLRDCGLLSDKRLDRAVRELLDQAADGKALARELIQRGVLTPYQANQILTGNGKSLVLGQYRIIERIGQGVTGQTFKAVHSTMSRPVVIRLLASHIAADPNERARFTREVQNIAQLSHTNILTAFDAFEVGGIYVLVMEYVEGMDLVRLVQHVGPLPVALACNFVRQTALGLQHAFERGLKHCNIRPENILIAGYQVKGEGDSSAANPASAVPRGVVKILNLGLAEMNEVAPALTGGTKLRLASVAAAAGEYAAPELTQAVRAADIRSDVYGLGCILYFALTGRTPFARQDAADAAPRPQEPQPLEQVRPEVPATLAAVVKRMLARNPVLRHQTPADVANDLTPFCVTPALAGKRA